MNSLPPAKLKGPMEPLGSVAASTEDEAAREVFQTLSAAIAKRWRKLRKDTKKPTSAFGPREKKKPSTSPYDTPGGFLRRRVYQLGVHYIESEKIEALRELFPDEVRRRAGVPSLTENVFYWILVHMFGRSDKEMTLAARNRMAKQLQYAYRHDIPPYLIVGFLHQIKDPQKISQKLTNEHYESWHPNYKDSMKIASGR